VEIVSRVRRAARAVGRSLWRNLTFVLILAVGLVLSRFDTAYNHMIGAYALVFLLVYNLKLWLGRASVPDLLLPATFLSAALWIWWSGTADVVPYMTIVYFTATALAYVVQLVQGRPLTFRDESRVAENYLDTGLRAGLAVACVVMSVAWMPQPRYLVVPFMVLLGFRLAAPLRRVAYGLVLKAVGLAPTSGRVRPASPAARRRGYAPGRAAVLAASAVAAAVVGPRLVFTGTRYDLTIPPPYMLPAELLEQRLAELDAYVAQPPGSDDSVALTELGVVLHSLGLTDPAALKRAETVLERAMFLDPDNAQAVAWYGSTLVAGAIHDQRPLARTRFMKSGFLQLDRAVRMAPDDPIVRLARADICLGVPSFVGRIGTARQDVDHMLELARTHPRETDPVLPLVYQRAGDTYALLGEPERARGYWEAALMELPERSEDYQAMAAQVAEVAAGRDGERRVAGLPREEARP
jgi:hypothetical protein